MNERDKIKTKFRKRLKQRLNERVSQYISNYERIKTENEETSNIDSLNDEVEILLIDVFSASNLTSNDFSIYFSFFEKIKNLEMMMTDLTNRFCDHVLRLIEFINFIDFDSNFFIYICTERYSSTEFFEVMIDSKTSRHFTTEYEQFLTYQKLKKEIIIDTSRIKAINVQFEIENVTFVDSININIFIDSVEFHVMKTNTSFLLSLADLNQLKTYLNNVKNVMMTRIDRHSVIKRFDHVFLL